METALEALFDRPYDEDDADIADRLLPRARLTPRREADITRLAVSLVEAVRADGALIGGVDRLLRRYAISTKEGLALMMLAEALLRVDDNLTADLLIADKVGQAEFGEHPPSSDNAVEQAFDLLLQLTATLVDPNDSTNTLSRLMTRLARPPVRAGVRRAMRLIGSHFVLAESIVQALARVRSMGSSAASFSFDMLGEAARTRDDAEKYYQAYLHAVQQVGADAGNASLSTRPGVSVKLSALHPRFDARHRTRVLAELVPLLLKLAQDARRFDLQLTVDAEEADRLELSLEVIQRVLADPSLNGWSGFGMAIQAYQKRADAVIDWAVSVASNHDRYICIRLVKGAYWDAEIKRAQERGLRGFPVFTRKALTDLNYISCAEKLLSLRDRVYPQFATHNALSISSIIERAGGVDGYEFQRLHGMGESLYRSLGSRFPTLQCRTYAPIGGHRELLAYLVRRLLENGANSSFVASASDRNVPVHEVVRHPADVIKDKANARHPQIRTAPELFLPYRKNSRGVEFGHRASLNNLLSSVEHKAGRQDVFPICDGEIRQGKGRTAVSPIDGVSLIGNVVDAGAEVAEGAMKAADLAFQTWRETSAEARASILERAADIIENSRGRLMHLLQLEAGKTLDDALAEVREAADFCRFYAAEGRRLFGSASVLPGPVGEQNELKLTGRGVFVAISPWNFPLAIFLGQVVAALMAGNTVIAKPAEQTPAVAFEAVRILHQAGIPASALQFVPGDGSVGELLVSNERAAGVVFTGSTEAARRINRQLASKDGAIVPLIAETGGINAMIVDATALPEQVADDVVTSCFRSAGQRCSALRVLYLQEEVADRVMELIVGCAKELSVGDPRLPSTDIGPIIDVEAQERLCAIIEKLKRDAKLIYEGTAPVTGSYIAPHIFELPWGAKVDQELFGPVLQVIRYDKALLDDVLGDLKNAKYGLTLGIQSRIDVTASRIIRKHLAGNIYVNRNMVGAVVGSQPFGGHGLSGTGPKAGGAHYLLRFVNEETITVNTAAAGGNASLMGIAAD